MVSMMFYCKYLIRSRYIVLLLMLLSGCSAKNSVNTDITTCDKYLCYDATIKKISTRTEPFLRTYVYAELAIRGNTNTDTLLLLENVGLTCEGKSSEAVYIDSIAHILIQPVTIKISEVYKKDIYWVFSTHITKLDGCRLSVNVT